MTFRGQELTESQVTSVIMKQSFQDLKLLGIDPNNFLPVIKLHTVTQLS